MLRIAEWLQEQPSLMGDLAAAGIIPGAAITARREGDGTVAVTAGGATVVLTEEQAERILVAA